MTQDLNVHTQDLGFSLHVGVSFSLESLGLGLAGERRWGWRGRYRTQEHREALSNRCAHPYLAINRLHVTP